MEQHGLELVPTSDVHTPPWQQSTNKLVLSTQKKRYKTKHSKFPLNNIIIFKRSDILREPPTENRQEEKIITKFYMSVYMKNLHSLVDFDTVRSIGKMITEETFVSQPG